MGSDPDRAYPYHAGWRATGCGVFLFGTLGGIGVALLPLGYAELQRDRLPIGMAMIVGGLFGIPVLVMAVLTLAGGVRDSFRPPLLRVTPTSLLLPPALLGEPPKDADGLPIPDARPPHPPEIPLAAVRSVKREGPHNPGSDKLVIAHGLAAVPLVVEQHMMRAADFEELEAVLRALPPTNPALAPG